MRGFLLGLCLLCTGLTYGQDLVIKLKNGQTNTFGIGTIVKVTHSTAEMEIHRVGGTIDKILLSSINYFNYNQGLTSSIYQQEQLSSSFSLYPNPSNGVFDIKFNSEFNSEYVLRVINTNGQLIYTDSGVARLGGNNININLDKFNNGIYFVELSNGSLKQLEKIVVEK